MGEVLKYRKAGDEPGRRQDTGRVARAWRWFSGRTVRRAERYRDLAWNEIVRHALAAALLVIFARIFRTEGFAPFALIAGAVWFAFVARIAIIKGADSWLRTRRPRG